MSDDDGFASPSPAEPDPPEFERPPKMEDLELDDLGETALIGDDVDCRNCAHYEVCSIIQGFAPMMDGWHTDDPPVDPHDLAAICDAYKPVED